MPLPVSNWRATGASHRGTIMSSNRPGQLALSIAVALLTSASSALAKPPRCTDASAPPSGPNGYYCVAIDRTRIHSYCLRNEGHNPKHVTQLNSYDALLTESFVRLHDTTPGASNPCNGTVAQAKLAEGDIVRIVKQKGSYLMQIWQNSGQPRFAAPVKLQAGKSGPHGEKYYLTSSQPDADYFVMLADDQDGQTTKPDVARIEKYFEIEVFPKPGAHAACDQERPDAASGSALANFHRWTDPADVNCSAALKQQAGSGSGGSNYP
jgi:hypothetical protein